MHIVPRVETLAEYLRIAEEATVIYLSLADEADSFLVNHDGQWFLVINLTPTSVSDG